jgi:hypothetical protein
MGPLGNDLGSIAAIVAVLRQSSETGGGVKAERTNRGFVVIAHAGISLQRISLAALIIALGLLIDDAMIAVENDGGAAGSRRSPGEGRNARFHLHGLSHADGGHW